MKATKSIIILLIAISSSLGWIQVHQNLPMPNAVAAVAPPAFKQPETLHGLLALPPAELEHCDIARMNLLCAEALPGVENLNVEEYLATLDQWAQHIKAETDRNYHHFKEDPAYYSNSEAFYKMLMMSSLQVADPIQHQAARWPNRDPYASDPAFLFQHNEIKNLDGVLGLNDTFDLYLFCDNSTYSQWDYLGLLSASGGVPIRGILEHNSYLEFTVKCGSCCKFVFDYVDYSGAVPALEGIFGKSTVDSLAGTIPPASGLGGFRGYDGDAEPNCAGTPVKPQVYMRTRFASYTDAPLKGGKGAAAYAAGTIIYYHCQPCGPPTYIPGPGNPVQ